MSQEVDSYREALEEEIKKWAGYERALRREDRQAFQELMNMARSYAAEACCTQSKIIFEPMTMSIILALENYMKQIEEELSQLKPPKQTAPETREEKSARASELFARELDKKRKRDRTEEFGLC